MTSHIVRLETGADARIRNPGSGAAVILLNGGTARPAPGTWSATSELLAEHLAPRRPDIAFVEVRYLVKAWSAIPSCVSDGAAALRLVTSEGADRVLLVGFSMGGAISIGIADDPVVAGVLGLAPWIPDRLSVDCLAGKRLDVVHGGWDRAFPGVPGVSAAGSRRGFDRAVRAGAYGTYTVIERALHGAALRRSSGRLVRLPRWRVWVDETSGAVDRFAAPPS